CRVVPAAEQEERQEEVWKEAGNRGKGQRLERGPGFRTQADRCNQMRLAAVAKWIKPITAEEYRHDGAHTQVDSKQREK
ncbi:hypothetical protein KUCAC02_032366, partial [Chaenocephalus aceratus]